MRRSDREINTREGIEEILLACKTCHVAMIDGDTPYVVPLNFGYKIDADNVLELYFHSAKEGKKLDIINKNNKVSFAISNEGETIDAEIPCNLGSCFFSVIGFGEAVILNQSEEKCAALAEIVKHQFGRDAVFTAGQAETVCVFKIVSADYTGKRKVKPPA